MSSSMEVIFPIVTAFDLTVSVGFVAEFGWRWDGDGDDFFGIDRLCGTSIRRSELPGRFESRTGEVSSSSETNNEFVQESGVSYNAVDGNSKIVSAVEVGVSLSKWVSSGLATSRLRLGMPTKSEGRLHRGNSVPGL